MLTKPDRPRQLTETPPDAPLPRFRIVSKTVALLGGIIGIYVVSGAWIFAAMQGVALAMANTISAESAVRTTTGVSINGVGVDIRLYWVTAALTLIGVSAFVFRTGIIRLILATTVGVAIIVVGTLCQLLVAVELAAHGMTWADTAVSGSIAFIVAMVIYLAGFVVQMQLMLSRRSANYGSSQPTN